MFGGLLENGTPTNELWAFKVHKKVVQLLEPDSPLEARSSHTGITVKRKNPNGETEDYMVIFGGLCKKKKAMNSICIYNPLTNIWLIDKDLNNSPKPRYCHSATFLDPTMYIYGGITEKGEYLSDMHSFGVDNFQWQEIKIPLPKKAYHEMITHDKDLFIFGGNDSEKYSTSTIVLTRDQVVDKLSIVKEIQDGSHKWLMTNLPNGFEDPVLLNRFLIERINDHFVMIFSDNYTDKNTASAIFHITPPKAYEMKDLNCEFGNDPFVDSISSNPIQQELAPMPRPSARVKKAQNFSTNSTIDSEFQERVMKLQNSELFHLPAHNPNLGKVRMAPTYSPVVPSQNKNDDDTAQNLVSKKSHHLTGGTLPNISDQSKSTQKDNETKKKLAGLALPKDQMIDEPPCRLQIAKSSDLSNFQHYCRNQSKTTGFNPNNKVEPSIQPNNHNESVHQILNQMSIESIKLKPISSSTSTLKQAQSFGPSQLKLNPVYDENQFALLIGIDLSLITPNSYQETVISRKLKMLYTLISQNNDTQKQLDDSLNCQLSGDQTGSLKYFAKVISIKDKSVHLINLNRDSTVDMIKNECGKVCGYAPTKISFRLNNSNVKEVTASLLSQILEDITLQVTCHATLIVE